MLAVMCPVLYSNSYIAFSLSSMHNRSTLLWYILAWYFDWADELQMLKVCEHFQSMPLQCESP